MPREVVPWILDKILVQIQDTKTDRDYHVLSSVLETILKALLHFKPASMHKGLVEVPPKFCFPFVYVSPCCVSETILPSEDDDAVNLELSSSDESEITNTLEKALNFSNICDTTLIINKRGKNEAEGLKVLFCGLLTLFDISNKVKLRSFVQKFSQVEPFIHAILNYIESKTCMELIACSSSKFTASTIKKNLVSDSVSWDMDISYLAFLVYGGWNELSSRLERCDRVNLDSPVFKIGVIAKFLIEVLPLSKEQVTESLMFIADNKLIGMDYAMDIFVQNPCFLEKDEVLACLEKSTPQPAKETLRYALLNAIMEHSISQRNRLVTIFFDAMKGVPVTDQQKILHYFLLKYGLTENLKQPTFLWQMSRILNQTVNAEEAEKQIILLCLQSPKECVSRIIHQAVNGNSGQIPVLVKMLKVMSGVCAFRVSQDISLLLSEFKPFFSAVSSTPQQFKNMKTMIQESLQVLGDNDGLKPSELLIRCVFPCMSSEISNVQVLFILEIMEIVFSSALTAKKSGWLTDLNIPPFIIFMGKVISCSIAEKMGSVKEKAVSILNLMSELQHLEKKEKSRVSVSKELDSWIAKQLSTVNPFAQLYIWKFIKKYTSPAFVKREVPTASLSLVWLHSCVYEENMTTGLKEVIMKSCDSKYGSLLAVSLAQLLPHLTLQEWLHSSILLEECLEFVPLNLQDFGQLDLRDRNHRLPMSLGTFVDALLLLKTRSDVSLDWLYMVFNLTQVVSNRMNTELQEPHPKTFVALFLELCRLSSHLKEEHLKPITVLLIDLIKNLKEMLQVKGDRKKFFPCLYAATTAMPDCVARSSVLDFLKIFE